MEGQLIQRRPAHPLQVDSGAAACMVACDFTNEHCYSKVLKCLVMPSVPWSRLAL